MNSVYLLWYVYDQYGDNENEMFIGVYDTGAPKPRQQLAG